MGNRKSTSFIVLLGIMLLSTAGAILFLFRKESFENASFGNATYVYEWGQRAWLLADTDQDGRIDTKAKLDRETGYYPEEFWEDRDQDGLFEVHVVMDGADISIVEIDTNRDGIYETREAGNAALTSWERITSGLSE